MRDGLCGRPCVTGTAPGFRPERVKPVARIPRGIGAFAGPARAIVAPAVQAGKSPLSRAAGEGRRERKKAASPGLRRLPSVPYHVIRNQVGNRPGRVGSQAFGVKPKAGKVRRQLGLTGCPIDPGGKEIS